MQINGYCVNERDSILETLKVINKNAIAAAVVCDDQQKVLGIVTDGDIRRALVKGVALSFPITDIYTREFVSVGTDTLRADMLELMQARHIEQVPIIDEQGFLKGIHTMHSILGHVIKPNIAVIMVGGKGSRLGKITRDIPKPMLRVAGRPILERIILHLVSHGIKKIYLAVNHLSHVIENYFGDGRSLGCSIEYLREEKPLGTCGALSLLPELPNHPVLLMNGDLLLEADFSHMLDFHVSHDFFATMGVHFYTHEVPFGCIETDGGRILSLEEKPILNKVINGGVYILSPEAISLIPSNTFYPVTELFDESLKSARACGAYFMGGDWIDIGQPEQLKQARGDA